MLILEWTKLENLLIPTFIPFHSNNQTPPKIIMDVNERKKDENKKDTNARYDLLAILFFCVEACLES